MSEIKKNLEKKIRFPKRISDNNQILKKLEKVFNDKPFFEDFLNRSKKIEKKELNPNSMFQDHSYKPQTNDLMRLYEFIILNKRTTVLEFGSGWSTLIISIALNQLKKKYEHEIKELRRSDPFKIFTVENEKKFLNVTKKRVLNFSKCKNLPKNIFYHFAECNLCLYENKYAIEYTSLPICNPDFIYIDGPDIFNVKGQINKFSYGHQDIMPIICDILKMEYFLIPGTIILMDGRTANAQFLADNFKRKWLYYHDKVNDQNVLFLDAPSLGKLNNRLLDFYFSN